MLAWLAASEGPLAGRPRAPVGPLRCASLPSPVRRFVCPEPAGTGVRCDERRPMSMSEDLLLGLTGSSPDRACPRYGGAP
ncbi:hypothetical protein IMZ48_09340 [Candidatus Bathyarchaeota archaeon]|nr:hypothetical protein [Candidatus Bathyarchaeota archaeon]